MSEEEVEELIAIYKDKGRLQTAKRLGNMFQSYQKVVLENTQLKSVLKEIREFIEVEKEAGILWTERSTNVILEIIDKGIGEEKNES